MSGWFQTLTWNINQSFTLTWRVKTAIDGAVTLNEYVHFLLSHMDKRNTCTVLASVVMEVFPKLISKKIFDVINVVHTSETRCPEMLFVNCSLRKLLQSTPEDSV